jgi:hypothetical protein
VLIHVVSCSHVISVCPHAWPLPTLTHLQSSHTLPNHSQDINVAGCGVEVLLLTPGRGVRTHLFTATSGTTVISSNLVCKR